MNALIQKKIRQYLVHSFIYYKLGESIISDNQFDLICYEILQLIKNSPEKFSIPYKEIIATSLSNEASGFNIRKYPDEIVSSALHLLYQCSFRELVTFETFLARFGYSIKKIK